MNTDWKTTVYLECWHVEVSFFILFSSLWPWFIGRKLKQPCCKDVHGTVPRSTAGGFSLLLEKWHCLYILFWKVSQLNQSLEFVCPWLAPLFLRKLRGKFMKTAKILPKARSDAEALDSWVSVPSRGQTVACVRWGAGAPRVRLGPCGRRRFSTADSSARSARLGRRVPPGHGTATCALRSGRPLSLHIALHLADQSLQKGGKCSV